MKKRLIISLILVIVLALSMFVACKPKNPTPDPDPTPGPSTETIPAEILTTMIDTIKRDYKTGVSIDNAAASFVTAKSYKMPAIATYVDIDNNKDYEVAVKWTSSVADVTVGEPDANNYVTINVPADVTAEISYTLTATLVDADGVAYTKAEGGDYSTSFTFKVPVTSLADTGAEAFAQKVVTEPVANVGYKLGTYKPSTNTMYYFKGTVVEGYSPKMETTTNYAEAADVFVEVVDGGYYLYFMNGTTKTYIELFWQGIESDSDKYNAAAMRFVTEPTIKFAMDPTAKTLRATSVFQGWVEQTTGTFVQEELTETAYLGIRDKNLADGAPIRSLNGDYIDNGKYKNGEEPACLLSGEVILPEIKEMTVEEIKAAVDALLEGESMTQPVSLTGVITDHTYSSSFKNSEGHIQVTEDWAIMYYRLAGGSDLAVGDTIKVTGTITNYNGTIEFKAGCTYEIIEKGEGNDSGDQGGTTTPVVGKVPQLVTAPVAGTAYKLVIDQTNLGSTLYILNESKEGNAWYQLSTTDYTAAADVFVEEATGGFYLAIGSGADKLYLNITFGDHTSLFREAAPTSVWVWDSENNCLKTSNADGSKTAYIGTYSSYNTFSASDISKLSGSFAAYLAVMVDGEVDGGDSGSTGGDSGSTGGDSGTTTPPATTHAGTLADPYSVADALAVAGALAEGEYTEKIYVKGIIKSIGSTGRYLGNVYIVDEAGSAVEILVYSVNFTTDIAQAYVNDTVVIYGYITNYDGTLEISSNKINGVSDYPTFAGRVAGTSTISVGSTVTNAEVVLGATSGVNDTTFTFTITPATGYEVEKAYVNGVAVDAVDGTYTGTIAGNTVVTVDVKVEGSDSATIVTVDLTAQGYANEGAVTSCSDSTNVATVAFDKGSNSNAPKWYDTGSAVRVYGGGTFNVSVGTDYVITKIVITFGSGDKTNTITVNSGTLENGVWVGSANSVLFTIDGTTGHRRIAKIEISYVPTTASAE